MIEYGSGSHATGTSESGSSMTFIELCRSISEYHARECFRWNGKEFIFYYSPGPNGRFRKCATATKDQMLHKAALSRMEGHRSSILCTIAKKLE